LPQIAIGTERAPEESRKSEIVGKLACEQRPKHPSHELARADARAMVTATMSLGTDSPGTTIALIGSVLARTHGSKLAKPRRAGSANRWPADASSVAAIDGSAAKIEQRWY